MARVQSCKKHILAAMSALVVVLSKHNVCATVAHSLNTLHSRHQKNIDSGDIFKIQVGTISQVRALRQVHWHK